MDNKHNPYLLGIAGPSCSGKTELANSLIEKLKKIKPIIISLDSYYKDLSHIDIHDRQNRNFDCPEAIDMKLLKEHLRDLKEGETINKPVYDFTLHTRRKETETISPGNLVIVEGLFILYDESLRNLFNKSVYVEIDNKTALSRRLKRDITRRGRSEEFVIKQFYNQVIPMAEKYVLPIKKYANMIISGTDPIEKLTKAILDIIPSDFHSI